MERKPYIARKALGDEDEVMLREARRREANALSQRRRRERLKAQEAGEVSPEDPLEEAANEGFEACMEMHEWLAVSRVKIVEIKGTKYLHFFHPDDGDEGGWSKLGEHALYYQTGMSGEDMFQQLLRCSEGNYNYDAETDTIELVDKSAGGGFQKAAEVPPKTE